MFPIVYHAAGGIQFGHTENYLPNIMNKVIKRVSEYPNLQSENRETIIFVCLYLVRTIS